MSETQDKAAAKARLNMKHGFMKSIIRNQVDRDNYDRKVKAVKPDKPKNHGAQSNRSKKPDIQTYRPPNRRQQGQRVLFKFEYEDRDGCIHERVVYKDDDPSFLARSMGGELGFTLPMMKALTEFLRQEISIAAAEEAL